MYHAKIIIHIYFQIKMTPIKLRNNTGLATETNICFLNAALQALNSLDFCRTFFVNREYDTGNLGCQKLSLNTKQTLFDFFLY